MENDYKMQGKIFCINCQKEFPADSLYCPFCGAPNKVTKEADKEVSTDKIAKKKARSLKFILVGSSVLVAILLIFYHLFFSNKIPKPVQNSKINNVHRKFSFPADVYKKESVGCPERAIEYLVLFRRNQKGKKFLSLAQHSYIFKNLNYKFSANTNIYHFRLICKKSVYGYLLFKAEDAGWFVTYLWDIRTNQLYFIARKSTTHKIYKSKNLGPGSRIEYLLKKYY